MMARPKVLVSWSSGKDSAWALHCVRAAGELEVVGLLTTVTERFDRVAMHAVRRTLLHRQAQACRLPLHEVVLPWPCANDDYETAMRGALEEAACRGVEQVVFGDLFLEDVKAYRDRLLKSAGLVGAYPLWGRDTRALAHEMVAAGLRATLTCVDPRQLSADFAGRTFDAALLRDLPEAVDPCGERGEFHTFVHAGPMLDATIGCEAGMRVEREGFVYTDLRLPGEADADPSTSAP